MTLAITSGLRDSRADLALYVAPGGAVYSYLGVAPAVVEGRVPVRNPPSDDGWVPWASFDCCCPKNDHPRRPTFRRRLLRYDLVTADSVGFLCSGAATFAA